MLFGIGIVVFRTWYFTKDIAFGNRFELNI